ncbi:hypothetical protein [Mesorhizobium australicum]|nr:hypothetical protein [Mesorhizobium australicum]
MAMETTDPSMNPMLDARIAAASTYRRREDGQKVDAEADDTAMKAV